jgi:hypothetical protein
MALPKIVYHPLTVDVTVTCVRGPQNFSCGYKTRAWDNVASSGLRERVFEGNDMLISFGMGHLIADDDLDDWTAFMKWALQGGTFKFYPAAALTDYYNCVSDDTDFSVTAVAPKRYAATFRFRIVPDSQAPADPSAVVKKYLGVS